jgi:hypothetical protein
MIEVKTLEQTPVPDPSSIPIGTFRKLISLVTERLKSNSIEGIKIEKEIDRIVCDLYNLDNDDRLALGIE